MRQQYSSLPLGLRSPHALDVSEAIKLLLAMYQHKADGGEIVVGNSHIGCGFCGKQWNWKGTLGSALESTPEIERLMTL